MLRYFFVPLFRLLTIGCSKGEHITRYYFYEHIKANHKEARDEESRVLTVSHSQSLARALGFVDAQITDAAYPDYDIRALPFADNFFDAVVSDQVLEHVEGSPVAAVEEAMRVLKPGGIVLHSSCFINPIHGAPRDYWRFSPDAMELLVREDAEVIDVGGWGNIFIWLFFGFGVRYERIPHNRWHPINWLARWNQARIPVTTWVLARKNQPKDKS